MIVLLIWLKKYTFIDTILFSIVFKSFFFSIMDPSFKHINYFSLKKGFLLWECFFACLLCLFLNILIIYSMINHFSKTESLVTSLDLSIEK